MTEPTYTALLAALLQTFNGCLGKVAIKGRSLAGFGESSLLLTPPFGPDLDMPVVRQLVAEYELRATICTVAGNTPVTVPMLSVLWRPLCRFVNHRHVVTEAGIDQVRAALETMPAPSVLVDAGPEVWSAWRLTLPLAAAKAAPALVALAQQLQAETPPADLRTFTVPIGGPVRNWNANVPDPIVIVVADPDRRYDLDEILPATRTQPEGTADERTDDSAGSGRRRRTAVRA